jgi:hypothetical protein
MTGPGRLASAAAALLLCAAAGPAQGRGIELLAAGEPAFSVSPGALVTRVFLFANTSVPDQDFRETVALPKGWRLVSGGAGFHAGMKGGDTRIVSFLVPRRAPPGVYRVSYTVAGLEDAAPVEAGVELAVTVLPVGRLSTVLVDSPAFVIAGEGYTATVRVLNAGNMTAAVRMGTYSSEALPVLLDAPRFTLEPGEARVVTVKVRTSADISRSVKHLLRISAALQSDPLRPETAACVVEILPLVTGREDPYHRLPLTLAVTQVMDHGEANTYGIMAELAGSGTLDEEGKKRVDFSLRAPMASDPTLFTDPAAFSLGLRTDGYSLFLGDRFYTLSALTEPSVYGRGVQAGVDLGPVSLGGTCLVAAPGFPTEELSAAADLRFDREQSVGVRYLLKGGDPRDSIASVETVLRPTRSSGLDIEAASGLDFPGGQAFQLNLAGSRPGFAYQLKAAHAGSAYNGGLRDTSQASGAIALPFSRGLLFTASFGARENGLSAPTPFRQEVVGFGLRWRAGDRGDMGLSWNRLSHNLPPAEPWTRDVQETLLFRASRLFNRLKLDASAALGQVGATAARRAAVSEQCSASATYRLDGARSLGASLSVVNLDAADPSALTTVLGLSADLEILPRAVLHLQYSGADRRTTWFGGRDIVTAGLGYRLADGAELGLQGQYAPDRATGSLTDYRVTLTYRTPLSLELGKNRSRGRITGRVRDQEGGRGMAGVILRLDGAVAVSDDAGGFLFHSLSPGAHELFADAERAGPDRVMTAVQPIRVQVGADGETTVDLEVARAGSISGRVTLYRSIGGTLGETAGSPAGLAPGPGLANLLVQIRRDGETLQSVTDREGFFRFPRIRPGVWMVTLAADALPENTLLEKPSFSVTLAPGQDWQEEVRALPVRRSIRMMDGGTIQAE